MPVAQFKSRHYFRQLTKNKLPVETQHLGEVPPENMVAMYEAATG
jgi:hypothetical protein